MRLRTKLISGFMGVVVLAALLGGLSWYSMGYMGKRADQAVSVDKATMDLLLAKISQLRFLYYGERQEIDLTRQYAADSEKLYAQLASGAGNSVEASELRTLLNNLHDYSGRFDELVRQSDALASSDAALLTLTAGMDDAFARLQADTRAALQQQVDPARLDLFSVLAETRARFNLSRIAMLTYRSSPSDATAAKAEQAITEAETVLGKVVSQVSTSNDRASLQNLSDQLQIYKSTFEQNMRQRADMREYIAGIHQLVLTTADLAGKATSKAVQNLNAARGDSLKGVSSLTLLVLALGIIISFLLTRSVLAQLGKDPGELAAVARRVSGGDFNIDDGGQARGVYADLKAMVQSLRENIDNARRESEHARNESGKAHQALEEADAARHEAERAKRQGMLDAAERLEKIVNVVSSAAERLAGQMSEAARGVQEQADRISETATAMEEMNSTMVEVAHNAASASEASGRMRTRAVDGSRIMDNAVTGMTNVRQQSSGVKNSMEELTGHVQAINRIMGVISDIADQTNLLALNAAIEAARAGDAGRGFAVVADEVRKLAEKTIASTSDVANVIGGINRSAEENVRLVDGTVQEIETTTALVDQSGGMLEEIAGLVDDTADQVRLIATASEQQSAASEEINQSMSQVNNIAVNLAEAMREGSMTVNALTEQAHELSTLIATLKKG